MTETFKDVAILLPGIMGSALAKDGRPIWDLTAGAVGRALYTLGDSLKDLELSSDASTGDDVAPVHLLQDVHIIPGLWKIDGYSGLSKYLQKRLGTVFGENFFEFPYDWRLDNRVSAQRLKSAALDWLENWRSRPGNQDARLVLIAHSMGGLVARYFLEALGGWKETRMLITLGTPHRGSVKALDFLVNGLRKKVGPVTLVNLTEMIQSFPSVHQLLPEYRCVGENEHDLKSLEDIEELGKLDLDRARAAIEFHREIERAIEKNAADPAYASSRYQLLPVVGTYQPTYLSALITQDGIKPIRTYKGRQMLDGDGTVPRLSATPKELSKAQAEFFVACPHASLQNFDPVQVQVRARLEDVDIGEIRAAAVEPVILEMDDIYSSAENFRIRARCDAALDPMHAMITNIDTGETTEDELEFDSANAEWQHLDRSPLPAGAYRIQIDPGEPGDAITDVFMVMD
jgi:pimeloyl-ACP methyl ester carboxylesterase